MEFQSWNVGFSAKPAAVKKPAPVAAKKAEESEDSSDDDVDEKPAQKAPLKRKPADDNEGPVVSSKS